MYRRGVSSRTRKLVIGGAAAALLGSALAVGTGMWEDDSASGALGATLRFAALLAEKGIPHELDVWGSDTPHDWPAWSRMLAKYLARLT